MEQEALTLQENTCSACQEMNVEERELAVGHVKVSETCWSMFNKAVSLCFINPEILSRTLQKITASYGLQHPSRLSKQSIKSVYMNIMSLYFFNVEGLDAEEVNRSVSRCISNRKALEWLEPPILVGLPSIAYLFKAKSFLGFQLLVDEWSEIIWQSWYMKHYVKIEALMYSK